MPILRLTNLARGLTKNIEVEHIWIDGCTCLRQKPEIPFLWAAQVSRRTLVMLLLPWLFEIARTARSKLPFTSKCRTGFTQTKDDPNSKLAAVSSKEQTSFPACLGLFEISQLIAALIAIYKTFPYEWIAPFFLIHDFQMEQSRQLRCKWFEEHLSWGSEQVKGHFEEISLAFLIGKQKSLGLMGLEDNSLIKQDRWLPFLDEQGEIEEGKGGEVFIHLVRRKEKWAL